MKKSIFALSALLLTSSFAIAFAQQPTETPKQTPSILQSGQVTAVDATNNQIIIKSEAGKEITLMISAETTITKEGKTVALADIKAGDIVTGECRDATDSCRAVSIQVMSAQVKPKQ